MPNKNGVMDSLPYEQKGIRWNFGSSRLWRFSLCLKSRMLAASQLVVQVGSPGHHGNAPFSYFLVAQVQLASVCIRLKSPSLHFSNISNQRSNLTTMVS